MLLDTTKSNLKVKKSDTDAGDEYRFASLSLYPNNFLCAGAKAARCMDTCISESGMAKVFPSVNQSRKRKSEFLMTDPEGFLKQLRRELTNFSKLCDKQGKQGVVRLNVFSDVMWEYFNIPQSYPELQFYDYTKIVHRLDRTPDNYRLMFSYSNAPQYQRQVQAYLDGGYKAPMAVVFKHNKFPSTFMGKTVIDGDKSDWQNVQAQNCVVGLVYKGGFDMNEFVVDQDLICKG